MCVLGIQGWQGDPGPWFHAFYINRVCANVGPLPVLWKAGIALWVQTWRQSFTPPWIHSQHNLILQLLQYRGRVCSSPLTLTWPCDLGQELSAEVTVCQVPAQASGGRVGFYRLGTCSTARIKPGSLLDSGRYMAQSTRCFKQPKTNHRHVSRAIETCPFMTCQISLLWIANEQIHLNDWVVSSIKCLLF